MSVFRMFLLGLACLSSSTYGFLMDRYRWNDCFTSSTRHRFRDAHYPETALQGIENPDFEAEETLLCVRLETLPNVALDTALDAVALYSQRFPFAAVLPVQPLTYLPTDDRGVEVKFLRKKTPTKSSIDGGIRFFIEPQSPEEQLKDDNVDGVSTIQVTAKRNSKGQCIAKIVAERLIVTNYVKGISGEEMEKYGKAPLDLIRIQSIFHKWM